MAVFVNGIQTGISSKNSTRNLSFIDAIGEKEDNSFSGVIGSTARPSVIGHLKAGYFHVHAPARVYPRLADAVSINNNIGASAAGAWVEGDKQLVIPDTAFDKPFDIHWVKIFTTSNNDEYVLSLYNVSNVLLGEVSFARGGVFGAQSDEIIQIPPQPANTAIYATLATKDGIYTRTVTIKFYIHEYLDVT